MHPVSFFTSDMLLSQYSTPTEFQKVINKVKSKEFNEARYLLGKINHLQITTNNNGRRSMNFFGNDQELYLNHIRHLYANKESSTCNSPSCPIPNITFDTSSITQLPSNIAEWFTGEGSQMTTCSRQFLSDPPMNAEVTYQDVRSAETGQVM